MSKASPSPPSSNPYIRRLTSQLINSWSVNKIVGRFPAVGWTIRTVTRAVVRHQIDSVRPSETQDTFAEPQTQVTKNIAQTDLNATLQGVVTDVVQALGYVGAMVATYAADDSLAVHAYYADPLIADENKIRQWEQQLSKISGIRLSLTDPEIARVYVHRKEYQNNLSVRAFNTQRPQHDPQLLSLFTPVVPDDKPLIVQVVRGIQEELGVREVIAIPFFIELLVDGHMKRELVGNLFALSRSAIQPEDENVLLAFGRQVAAALLSERRRQRLHALQGLVFDVQASFQNEQHILQHIVSGVVDRLGYVAAMVATYESDDSLPVRAYYVKPSIATDAQIRMWEKQVSDISGIPLSLTDPDIARVYVLQKRYAHNLSVKAYHSAQPLSDPDLFSLFRPIVPEGAVTEAVVRGIQEALGIRQVIAVPFFLTLTGDQQAEQVLVGNLFALSSSPYFTSGEIDALRTFGQQAAAGLRNARLYHQVEEQRQLAEARRKSAEIFGKMAFNAATNVHDLTNHVGMIRMRFNSIIKNVSKIEQLSEAQIQDFEKKKEIVQNRLDQATTLLQNLHEPWRVPPDAPTNINTSLSNALRKLGLAEEAWIDLSLAELPLIHTSPAMLAEAFRVIIKNAVEAIEEKGADRRLSIQSTLKPDDCIEVVIIDNGIGIKADNLHKIFDMGWSTKKVGLGFGLFWAKDFIEAGLDGKLQVESEWQRGTTFRIHIPSNNHISA